MCDQSRVAIAVTAERLKNEVREREFGSDSVPLPRVGSFTVACKVQDDKGGEGMWTGRIEVE